MPIDEFQVAYSEKSIRREFNVGNATDLMNQVGSILVEAGWTSSGIQARAAMRWVTVPTTKRIFPPIPDDEKIVVSSADVQSFGMGGPTHRFYDPETEIGGDSNCLPLGYTEEESVENSLGMFNPLIWEAIHEYRQTVGGTTSEWYIFIKAVPGGPGLNGIEPWFAATASINGTVMAAWGGGYTFTSEAANGRTTYKLDLYEEAGPQKSFFYPGLESVAAEHLAMRVYGATTLDAPSILCSLSARLGTYSAIANPYQLIVYSDTWAFSNITFLTGHFDRAILITAPCVDIIRGVKKGVDCVVVLDLLSDFSWAHHSQFEWAELRRNHTAQASRMYWGRSHLSVGGSLFYTHYQYPGTAQTPHAPLYREDGGYGIRTPEGRFISASPWLMVPTPDQEARIVGKLWDAVSRSDIAPVLKSEEKWLNRFWRQVMFQTGVSGDTRGSWWITFQEEEEEEE